MRIDRNSLLNAKLNITKTHNLTFTVWQLGQWTRRQYISYISIGRLLYLFHSHFRLRPRAFAANAFVRDDDNVIVRMSDNLIHFFCVTKVAIWISASQRLHSTLVYRRLPKQSHLLEYLSVWYKNKFEKKKIKRNDR